MSSFTISSPNRRRAPTLALVLLAVGVVAPAQSTPPSILGVGLGSSVSEVRRDLGAPDRVQESIGMRFWDYTRKGVTIIWRDGEPGLGGLVLTDTAAGPIRGVRVGDTEALLRTKWGEPARVRQDGRFFDFVEARWVLSVELRNRVIVTITAMAAADARPATPPARTPSVTTAPRSRRSR